MRYFYLRDANNHRVACVASELVGDEEHKRVVFEVATHNPKDKFDTQVARMVAAGRLKARQQELQGRAHSVVMGPRVKHRIVITISMLPGLPQRTREAAELWLSAHQEDHGNPLVR